MLLAEISVPMNIPSRLEYLESDLVRLFVMPPYTPTRHRRGLVRSKSVSEFTARAKAGGSGQKGVAHCTGGGLHQLNPSAGKVSR